MRDLDRARQDVGPLIQIGLHTDASVGQQKPPPVARNFHQDDLADDPTRPQAALAIEYGPHELGSGDLSLHECLRVARAHQVYRDRRDLFSLGVPDGKAPQVDGAFLGHGADRGLVTDEGGTHPAAVARDCECLKHGWVVAAGHG